MSKKYPRVIRKQRAMSGGRKTCVECLIRTKYSFEIQWNYMRGDDSVIKMCRECQYSKTDTQLLELA